jgi:hypothetical protein
MSKQTNRVMAVVRDDAKELEERSGGIFHDRIEERAHELWEARGCPDGSPEVDWFQAEQEMSVPRDTGANIAA